LPRTNTLAYSVWKVSYEGKKVLQQRQLKTWL
jgi:hypothetical protein